MDGDFRDRLRKHSHVCGCVSLLVDIRGGMMSNEEDDSDEMERRWGWMAGRTSLKSRSFPLADGLKLGI